MNGAGCHYCTRPAEQECPQCGRLFCGIHGEDVCLRCLAPEAATPSALVYRGSLLALAIGTLVTIFLLVRPPRGDAGEDAVRTLPTATSAVSATATPTRAGSRTPGVTATAAATQTPSPAGNANRSYTIREGDSLSSIAAAQGTTVEAIEALNPGVTPGSLQPGATLILPPLP